MTVMRCVVGVTDGFKLEVGLHQGGGWMGSRWKRLDYIKDEIRQETPWTLRMFADNTVIFSESKEQAEERLET